MDGELTLEVLDNLIMQTKDEIVGFVVSPADARSLRQGTEVICGVDDYKVFVSPPYTGISIYISESVKDGCPIKLIKRNTLRLNE